MGATAVRRNAAHSRAGGVVPPAHPRTGQPARNGTRQPARNRTRQPSRLMSRATPGGAGALWAGDERVRSGRAPQVDPLFRRTRIVAARPSQGVAVSDGVTWRQMIAVCYGKWMPNLVTTTIRLC